jgi:DNA repair protein RadD
MRLYPGKDNCLLLDYGENIARHGCIDTAQPDQEVKVRRPKICGECLAISPPHAKKCVECLTEFPVSMFAQYLAPIEERKVAKQTKAASGAVISDEKPGQKAKEENVVSVNASLATSKNGNDYCRVFFQIEDSFLPRSMPLMFEHPRMNGLAKNYWCRIVNTKQWGVPRRSQDAVAKINDGAMDHVKSLSVKKEGKYFNVKKLVTANKEVYL